MNITILILTRNAEETISRTLENVVSLNGRIIIIDDYSTDKTIEIAQMFNCTIMRNHCYDFGLQRAFALSQVTTDWTLVLDSDEVLTEENCKEITEAVANRKHDGYYLHFRNHLFGKKLLHGELHKKLVLFKTKHTSSNEKLIHEQYEVHGTIGTLAGEVSHYSYRSFSQIIEKFFDYSVRQAKQYKKENKQYGIRELLLYPLHMFYSRTVVDQGYKDGFARILLDALFAKMEFFSYALIPFVKGKKRISVDCGAYAVNSIVKSGIERVIQGIYSQKSDEFDYYWFGFHANSSHKLPTRFYSQIWLPLQTILKRCDVFLGTGGTIPWVLQFFSVKKVLFLYDFGFFSSPEKYIYSAKRLQVQTERAIQYADKIIILHNEIYQEFEKRYPHLVYKVEVISSGADHLENIKENPVFIQPKKPLILFVGVVKPVKRIDKLLSVVGKKYTVIAGSQEPEYIKTLKIEEDQNIQFIQNFNDGQVKWLYKNADVMIYTSEHEGFCYPVLEALIEGLPVIAFNLPIFQEYKQFFPHLKLVSDEQEMKEELLRNSFNKAKNNPAHPYRWREFNNKVLNIINSTYQLAQLPEAKCAFIVVLYKTARDEKARLEKEINNLGIKNSYIYWIDNSANGKGYAAGINEGIREGLKNECDYYFALNPDISLKNVTAQSLLSAAQIFDVWGYAMKQNSIVYYGGEIDKWRLSGGLFSMKPNNRFAPVDFISGSAMGFSKRVIQTVGFWEESYFMYYEDVDYCVRAKQAGFSVGIDSEVLYDHFEVSQLNKKKEQWIAKSRWTFFWKYSNLIQKMREIIRLPKTLLDS